MVQYQESTTQFLSKIDRSCQKLHLLWRQQASRYQAQNFRWNFGGTFSWLFMYDGPFKCKVGRADHWQDDINISRVQFLGTNWPKDNERPYKPMLT